jgi:hypothetical protein
LIIDDAARSPGMGLLLKVLIRSLHTPKPKSVVLLGRYGTKLTIPSSLRGFDALLDSLLPELIERLLAAARSDLERGVAVSFGKRLKLGPDGNLTHTFLVEQVLHSDKVASIEIERALLLITRRDTGNVWQRIPVRAVPNVGVLMELLTR